MNKRQDDKKEISSLDGTKEGLTSGEVRRATTRSVLFRRR